MVTEITNQANSYRDAFEAMENRAVPGGASWLQRLRSNAMDRFEELGFPSVKDEEWKYTNVAAIAKGDFHLGVAESSGNGSDASELANFGSPETAASQLIFVNGKLRSDLSSVSGLRQGVAAIDLSEAIGDERYSEIVRTNLARHADYVSNGFTALNTAFVSEGAFVYIPKRHCG